MTRNTSDYYCDTTIVYYRLHGHPLQAQAVAERKKHGRLFVSNFVRGEYIRGYIQSLLELYFAIRAEDDVENGIREFASESAIRPRRLVNAFTSVTHWLSTCFEDSANVESTLRRLIPWFGAILGFDVELTASAKDLKTSS